MVTDLPQVFDACLRFRGNETRVFHIGVDVRIGHPQGVLVGERRAVLLQVRGRHLPPRRFRRTQVTQQLGALALAQTEKRHQVGGAVAKFGEKACDVLRRMIRANDQEFLLARERVLGNHALPSLDIALIEVRELLLPQRLGHGSRLGVGSLLNIHCDGVVRLDEL